ncbi:MAG: non-canonical purine NTP diphosphatase [Bacteroidaceae bacterium]|nr:non-canonical purine NTP diphosphatase [Bacteroidaceae bacterium]
MDCNSSENKATLVFATNNAHKLEEVRAIIGDRFEIKSLDDIGCHDDIPETADTLQGNALQKARYIKDKFGYDCFADDTGLICSALNGEPGVRSARYANDNNHEHDSEANMKLLLKNLSDKNDRSAYFMTVIALIYQGQTYTFNGVVNGVISHEKHGDGGFGYDPIFVPEGYDKTFAELGNEIKNTISHRARAVAKLDEFLKSC